MLFTTNLCSKYMYMETTDLRATSLIREGGEGISIAPHQMTETVFKLPFLDVSLLL